MSDQVTSYNYVKTRVISSPKTHNSYKMDSKVQMKLMILMKYGKEHTKKLKTISCFVQFVLYYLDCRVNWCTPTPWETGDQPSVYWSFDDNTGFTSSGDQPLFQEGYENK